MSIPGHDWDRHHYEAMLPGFGGSDSMDWRGFVDLLQERGFKGPFEIENEAKIQKIQEIFRQQYKDLRLVLISWPLCYGIWKLRWVTLIKKSEPLKDINVKDIPVITMDDLI
ncbi:hypothetical protein KUH03_09765 [Sphingobacterium sp. E70]|uniref:hypothetical protein n=1 Tax=Sphingobacterium sp. E70 TaxID=2853439 RepID=UPI00211CF5C5|nr:hypothetical protein [Sphingobacterium sp. E70]ULT27050.1 hypothetical protein KUH03_09765 [Sphingobacterium sp. E70]